MNYVWYDIHPEDIKFGLLVGTMRRKTYDPTPFKQWTMSLYDTERGRKMGIKAALKEYPGSDILVFLLKGKELFDKSIHIIDLINDKGLAKGAIYENDILSFKEDKHSSQ